MIAFSALLSHMHTVYVCDSLNQIKCFACISMARRYFMLTDDLFICLSVFQELGISASGNSLGILCTSAVMIILLLMITLQFT